MVSDVATVLETADGSDATAQRTARPGVVLEPEPVEA